MLKNELEIYYADDDADDRDFILMAFKKRYPGAKVTVFHDGFELVEHLKSLAPDESLPCVIIVDGNMPRYDGRTAAIAIKQIPSCEKIPIVLFSTSLSKRDEEFSQENNVAVMTKPADARQLANVVDQFVKYCGDEHVITDQSALRA